MLYIDTRKGRCRAVCGKPQAKPEEAQGERESERERENDPGGIEESRDRATL